MTCVFGQTDESLNSSGKTGKQPHNLNSVIAVHGLRPGDQNPAILTTRHSGASQNPAWTIEKGRRLGIPAHKRLWI